MQKSHTFAYVCMLQCVWIHKMIWRPYMYICMYAYIYIYMPCTCLLHLQIINYDATCITEAQQLRLPISIFQLSLSVRTCQLVPLLAHTYIKCVCVNLPHSLASESPYLFTINSLQVLIHKYPQMHIYMCICVQLFVARLAFTFTCQSFQVFQCLLRQPECICALSLPSVYISPRFFVGHSIYLILKHFFHILTT